jgi:chemotaxis protein histidine kinase CheA
MELINKIDGVTYKWNDSGRTDIGFIAEDVGKVLPCVVDYEENGVDAMAMDYTRINAVLVEAAKQQDRALRQQATALQDQKKAYEKQQKMISMQKEQLDKLTNLFETLTISQKDKFKSMLGLLKRR